jgi:hypothetical protein
MGTYWFKKRKLTARRTRSILGKALKRIINP